MLSQEQINFYHENGYLKIEGLFSTAESAELAADMVSIIEEWGEETIGWKGLWRDRYLKEDERENTKAVFLHNPHFYSAAWGRAIFHAGLIGCVRGLAWHHGPVAPHGIAR